MTFEQSSSGRKQYTWIFHGHWNLSLWIKKLWRIFIYELRVPITSDAYIATKDSPREDRCEEEDARNNRDIKHTRKRRDVFSRVGRLTKPDNDASVRTISPRLNIVLRARVHGADVVLNSRGLSNGAFRSHRGRSQIWNLPFPRVNARSRCLDWQLSSEMLSMPLRGDTGGGGRGQSRALSRRRKTVPRSISANYRPTIVMMII